MSLIVPPSFLFRYAFAARRIAELPQRGDRPVDLPESCRLPHPSTMDERTPFADVRVAWNDDGFAVAVKVIGKRKQPIVEMRSPGDSDGLQFWIDTRCTQNIHRASRFCHYFVLLPPRGKKRQPSLKRLPIAQAREEPTVDTDAAQTFAHVGEDGYELEAWLPAETLHGYDPAGSPKLGFFYLVKDNELGEQTPAVGRDFPFAHDPSVWAMLELKSG